MNSIYRPRRGLRGASLVEALVALLVMAFGMMGVAGIQGRLRYSGDAAKQRAEATRIATAEMERLRGFASLAAVADDGVLQFDEIVSEVTQLAAPSTEYRIDRAVNALSDGSLDINLNISWLDRTKDDEDTPMSVNWRSTIARVDPKLTLGAYVPPDFGVAQRRPLDRHVAIPTGAKNLDADRSVFKPVPGAIHALVFNNRTGLISQLCEVPAATATADLLAEDLNNCPVVYAGGAYLLSGHIVYSLGGVPDPVDPSDPVLPLGIAVNLTSQTQPNPARCFVDASANALQGIKATDYYCVIEPRTPPANDPDKTLHWSGRSSLTGLVLAAGGYRVCRYSDDYNGSGSIENAEHPKDYAQVNGSLSNQNFLVTAFAADCPAGSKVDVDHQVYRNTVTAQHQP